MISCALAMPPARTSDVHLRLPCSSGYPRQIEITLSQRTDMVIVSQFSRDRSSFISNVFSQLPDCRLEIEEHHRFLVMGREPRVSFRLSREDVGKIRATFEPHGLEVREVQP